LPDTLTVNTLITLSTNSYAAYKNAAMRELRLTKMPTEGASRDVDGSHDRGSYLAARRAAERAATERAMEIAMGELGRVIATTRRLTQITTEPGYVTPNIQIHTMETQRDTASRVRFERELQSDVGRRVVEAMYLKY
jgi:hypothetical protein